MAGATGAAVKVTITTTSGRRECRNVRRMVNTVARLLNEDDYSRGVHWESASRAYIAYLNDADIHAECLRLASDPTIRAIDIPRKVVAAYIAGTLPKAQVSA